MQFARLLLVLTLVSSALFIGPFLLGYEFPDVRTASSALFTGSRTAVSSTFSRELVTKNLHLLLPATAPNVDFCKLLLSAGILGYPEPILLGWGGRGTYNGSESHLFKLTSVRAYLRSLPASADDDLVLLLDAYDVWLQLRPDVLIRRYYDVLRLNDARLRAEGLLGRTHGGGRVQNSIVFGPDKYYWPQGPEDPATWAAPQSTLPDDAFGPETDRQESMMRPRWFNSGTIMGPVGAMREFFAAALDTLDQLYDAQREYGWRNSDQFFLSQVWAEQEVNRIRLRDGKNFAPPHVHEIGGVASVPDIPAGKKTEFGLCNDYETMLFQTAAGFVPYLTWMPWNGRGEADTGGPMTFEIKESLKGSRMEKWRLSRDVLKSEKPFAALEGYQLSDPPGWDDVMLGTNTVVRKVFPVFHLTGHEEKVLREAWWPRMWFYEHAEVLLKAEKRRRASKADPDTVAAAHGVRWKQAKPRAGSGKSERFDADGKGGAWVGDGTYLLWDDVCGLFEDEIYPE